MNFRSRELFEVPRSKLDNLQYEQFGTSLSARKFISNGRTKNQQENLFIYRHPNSNHHHQSVQNPKTHYDFFFTPTFKFQMMM